MLGLIEELRGRTLANNLLWLQSFGCRVERAGDVVYVEHRELRDYCALLLFAPPEESLAALRMSLAGERPWCFPPDVYVDETANSPALQETLATSDLVRISVNSVTVGEVSDDTGATDLTIRPAEAAEAARWSEIYSEGFGHSSVQAQLDLRRWRLSFKSDAVRHLFFVSEDEEVGVCQLCLGYGVVGVYSFTLKPEMRRRERTVAALQALRARLARRGGAHVYFERVKHKARVLYRVPSARYTPGFKVIRVSYGYRRLPTVFDQSAKQG